MTIEEVFFKVFGIKPKLDYMIRKKISKICYQTVQCSKQGLLDIFESYKEAKVVNVLRNYPEITAEKLLKLICILADSYIKQREFYKIKTTNVETLKEYVLGDCIDNLRYLYDTEKENFISLVRETLKECE